MKKWVVGNWKMHGTLAMARQLAAAVAEQAVRSAGAEVVLCPPAVMAAKLCEWLSGSHVGLGGQDCHMQPEGAYTGDISAPMLREAGCSHVIVGHSERRKAYGETDDAVRRKAAMAIASGLVPIICVGETLEERESGQAERVVGRQVRDSLPYEAQVTAGGNFLLAYEPVWAIGSGKTPTLDDIRQMHRHIVSVASKRAGCAPEAVAALYGGSVKADNAASIMAVEAVSGVLVGGASLKVDEFCRIIAAAE